jgi:hypothetical protein
MTNLNDENNPTTQSPAFISSSIEHFHDWKEVLKRLTSSHSHKKNYTLLVSFSFSISCSLFYIELFSRSYPIFRNNDTSHWTFGSFWKNTQTPFTSSKRTHFSQGIFWNSKVPLFHFYQYFFTKTINPNKPFRFSHTITHTHTSTHYHYSWILERWSSCLLFIWEETLITLYDFINFFRLLKIVISLKLLRILSFPIFLCENEYQLKICFFLSANVLLLQNSIFKMKNLIFASRKFVFDTMFSYIKDKLLIVPQLEEWKRDINDSNTFIFSLSPQVCMKCNKIEILEIWKTRSEEWQR